MQKDNIEELYDFLKFINTTIKPYIISLYDVRDYPELTADYEKKGKKLKEAIEYAKTNELRLEGSGYLKIMEMLGETPYEIKGVNPKKEWSFKPVCAEPFQTAYSSVDGNIRPCCNNTMKMGNILLENEGDIWFGKKYSRLRKSVLKGELDPECRICIQENRHNRVIF